MKKMERKSNLFVLSECENRGNIKKKSSKNALFIKM